MQQQNIEINEKMDKIEEKRNPEYEKMIGEYKREDITLQEERLALLEGEKNLNRAIKELSKIKDKFFIESALVLLKKAKTEVGRVK